MKSYIRYALISLILLTALVPAAWAEQQPAPAPSPAQSVDTDPPDGPDLAGMLHLSTAQIQVLQGINARVGEQLTVERSRFRQDMLAVLTDAQRTRLKQLVEAHQNEDNPSVDVTRELGLTSAQMTQMKGLHASHQARMDALWDDYIGQIKKVLTAEQAAALDSYLRSQATAP